MTFWIPGRGNEKLQVRKKNEEEVMGGGAAIFLGDGCRERLSVSAGAGVTLTEAKTQNKPASITNRNPSKYFCPHFS